MARRLDSVTGFDPSSRILSEDHPERNDAEGFKPIGQIAAPIVRAAKQARIAALRGKLQQALAAGDWSAASEAHRRLSEHESREAAQ